MSVVLTMVISSINIACIVITNIMTRVKEISTLRAIGMSMKNIKKMIIKESIITSGEVILDGDDISKLSENQLSKLRSRKFGFIFQSFNLIHQL